MKLKVITVVILFLLLMLTASSSVTLRQGEPYIVKEKTVIVENIKSDVIKVNVDGVKNIISVGEQKEVNGVNILVESAFYVDEPTERTVSVVMSVAYYCGDGNCDTDHNETKENCCEDCNCDTGYVCSDNVCKSEALIKKEQEEEEEASKDLCQKDADCDDKDPLTEDICKSTAGKPNKCLHIPPVCKTDIECDDQDPCTVDRCTNNDCFSAEVPDYKACTDKQKPSEEEKPETVAEEKPKDVNESSVNDVIKKEKGLFSKIIGFFLNLF